MAPSPPPGDWPLGPPADLVTGGHRLRTSAGRMARFDQAVTNTPHRHLRFHEFCLVVSGHGGYTHGHETHLLAPGMVFVADPGVTHEISSRRTRDLHLRFWEIEILASPAPRFMAWPDTLFEAFARGHRVAAMPKRPLLSYLPLLPGDPASLQVSVRLVEALVLEMIQTLTLDPPRGKNPAPAEDEAVAKVLAHVRSHPEEPLTGPDLARHVGMSERNLRLRVKKALGKSLHQVVLEQRLSLAAMLLGQHFKVAEVGRMVGIEDGGQFTRTFTRYFAMAPKAFQMKHYGDRSPPYTRHGRV